MASLLAGCSGFWDKPNNGGGGSTTVSGAFYVLNQKTSQVVGFTVPANSTTPTAISNGSATLGAIPNAIAISPNGSFLYVSTIAGIYAYSISTTGALTALNSNNVISNDLASSMQVDPSGKWLVNVVSGTKEINAIPIDSSTGLVPSGSTEQTANLNTTTPQQIAFAPNGSFIFIALGTGGTEMIPFSAGSTNPFGSTGTMIRLANPTNSTAASALSVAVDPSSRLFYVGETLAVKATQTGGLRAFTFSSTGLGSEVSGSPFQTGGTGPAAILADRSGSYVYAANKAVTNSNTSLISEFTVTTSGTTVGLSALNNGTTIATGITPAGIVEENTKTYVLVVNNGGSSDLIAYKFDTTGKLSQAGTAATGTDPTLASAIVAVP